MKSTIASTLGMRHLVALLLLVALPGVVLAQTETGRIVGSVTDTTGAVLPGASVNIKSASSGASRTATTDASGNYTFSNLQPGTYEVNVTLTGFKAVQSSTTVTAGAASSLTTKLEVGQVTEVVTVTAETGPTVNTVTQDISSTITEQQIRELPTVTRDPYDLVAIAGHVVAVDPVNDGSVEDRGTGYAINGQRTASTNVLLDGSANNDEFSASIGQRIPLDAVQEFSVITSNFSAEYGRASGGIVNLVTKSGTNEFHGNAYEFFRGDGLTANTFDNNAHEIEKGKFSRHQAGFTLGGPIQKDKTHFFVSGEYRRVRSTDTLITWVPTAEFLALTDPATQQYFAQYPLAIPINGPTITRGELTDLYGGDPSSPFNSLPAGLPVFGQVNQPVPDDAGGGTPQNTYQVVGRLDFNLSPSTTMYARYAYERETWLDGTNSQSPYEGFQSTNLNRNHNALLSLTRIWSPTFTTQTKVVYNRLRNEQPLGDQPPSPGLYMNPTTPVRIQGQRIGFPGYLPFGPGTAIPFGGPQTLIQAYQDLNWVTGKHDIRFGGSYVRIMDNRTFGAYQNAVMALNSSSAAGPALDNLVLGRLRRFQVAIDPNGFPGETYVTPVGFPSFTEENRYNEWAVYFNDSWSVTDRLRVNLGARYEYFGVQYDVDDVPTSNFYYASDDASVNTSGVDIFNQVRGGQVLRHGDSSIGRLWRPDRNNFAPRVGFAWDVNGDGRMSVRGGYGIGFERNFGNVTFNALFNPPDYLVASIDSPADVPVIPIQSDNQGPFGGVAGVTKTIPAGSLRHMDQNMETAYAHFYSLSVQRRVGESTLLSVEYTGSTGRKLYDLADVNIRGAGHVYLGDTNPAARPNPKYAAFNTRGNRGKSQYHGVTFGVESRKIANTGLTASAKYTLSQAKDNLSSTFSESSNAFNLGYLDPIDAELDYGYADFDARHRLSVGATWEVPLARDSKLWGGWQVNTIFTAQSGQPFTIYDCTNGFTRCMRAENPGGLSTNATSGTETGNPNEWNMLDLTPILGSVGAYIHPTQGTSDFGPYPADMTKRNQFRGPGRYYLDMSVAKRFRFGDRWGVQLRFEAFNVLNHPNMFILGDTADVSSATFITGSKGGPPSTSEKDNRRIQLAAKIEF